MAKTGRSRRKRMPVRQAVIIAGGRGSRLGALAADTPKPLLEVGGRPFVEHLISQLADCGVAEVILLVGPHRAAFRRALRPRQRSGPELVLVPEPAPAGTAGALWYARRRLADRLLLLNGDSFFEGDIGRLATALAGAKPPRAGAVAAVTVPDTTRYGRIECAGKRIATFREKGERGPGLINAGVYLFERARLLARIAKPPLSLERDVLPALAAEGALRAVIYRGRFVDIGTPESLAAARALFAARAFRGIAGNSAPRRPRRGRRHSP